MNKFLYLIVVLVVFACDTTSSDPEAVKQQERLDFIDTVSANYQLPDSVVVVKDSIVDERDSTVYQIVTIGEQTWFAENLIYKLDPRDEFFFYQHDSSYKHLGGHYPWSIVMNIPWDGEDDAFKSLANRNSQSEDSTTIDFEKIQGICPDGWHVPTVAEWETLFQTVSDIFDLGANEENDWQGVGKILKDTSYYHTEEKYRGVDLVGFKVIEAGVKMYDTWGLYHTSEFWTSDEHLDGAWAFWFGGSSDHYFTNINGVVKPGQENSRLIPVRCLMNVNRS